VYDYQPEFLCTVCGGITVYKVYKHERDRCKQYSNFILVINTALFSTAINGGCYIAAMVEILRSRTILLFGGILHTARGGQSYFKK
jgi:hypothetical protein